MCYTKFVRNYNNPKLYGRWTEVVDVRDGQMPPFELKRQYKNYYECVSDGEVYTLILKRKEGWVAKAFKENGEKSYSVSFCDIYPYERWTLKEVVEDVKDKYCD